METWEEAITRPRVPVKIEGDERLLISFGVIFARA